MEQFNPGLRNLINLGKNYEKAVNGKSVFLIYRYSRNIKTIQQIFYLIIFTCLIVNFWNIFVIKNI